MLTQFSPARIALALSVALLASCSTTKTAMKKVSSPIKGLSKMNANDWKMFRMSDLRGNAPPIVKVRKEDWVKMQTGEEKYLAWHEARQLGYASTDGTIFVPEDFDSTSLSDTEVIGAYGILPSLNSGDDPGEESGSTTGELPEIE